MRLDFAHLDERQRLAVISPAGPLLILAGPGSGKTSVITCRIAHLIASGETTPASILALAFTTRAARELRERVQTLCPEARDATIATVHAFGLRVLRRWADHFGYDPEHLSVVDQADRVAALGQVVASLGLDPARWPPDGLAQRVRLHKRQAHGPADLPAASPDDDTFRLIYQELEGLYRRRNLVDYDDMVALAVRLFRERPEALAFYQICFRHLLVDECQDLDHAQYLLVRLLAEKHHNVTAVGDPIQNLYAWRGSDIRHLLNLKEDFPELRVVELERNYRSTQTILQIADALAAVLAYGKRRLFGTHGRGTPAILFVARDAREEAAFVAQEIQRLKAADEVASFGECAVLYRTHAQAGPVEVALLAAGVPYYLIGEVGLLATPEVRTVLAYLRLLENPADSLALARAINTPPRHLAALARRLRTGLHLAVSDLVGGVPSLVTDAEGQAGLREFLGLQMELAALARSLPPARLVAAVVEKSGYERWLATRPAATMRGQRLADLRELAAASAAPDLGAFLAELLALEAEGEARSETSSGAVVLSTIHAAKGLEFPAVFVVGLAEGLLPHARALAQAAESSDALDAEVRLCYVAVTRAMRRLYLAYATSRELDGKTVPQAASRFLKVLPNDLVRVVRAS